MKAIATYDTKKGTVSIEKISMDSGSALKSGNYWGID